MYSIYYVLIYAYKCGVVWFIPTFKKESSINIHPRIYRQYMSHCWCNPDLDSQIVTGRFFPLHLETNVFCSFGVPFLGGERLTRTHRSEHVVEFLCVFSKYNISIYIFFNWHLYTYTYVWQLCNIAQRSIECLPPVISTVQFILPWGGCIFTWRQTTVLLFVHATRHPLTNIEIYIIAPKMNNAGWKTIFLSKWSLFSWHVNFGGLTKLPSNTSVPEARSFECCGDFGSGLHLCFRLLGRISPHKSAASNRCAWSDWDANESSKAGKMIVGVPF